MDITDKETSDLRNVTPDDVLPGIKDGLRRLAKIYYWPVESGESPDFKALCEFVIFNVGMKRPFFEELLGRLLNRVGNLCHLLLNSLDDDTPQITYEEAYVLLRKLKLGNTRDLLNKLSCSSNMLNGILKSIKILDYDLFLSSLHESDNKKMMQVLWEMRYILYGIDHYVTNIEPTGQIKVVNRWLDSQSYNFTRYFYYYKQLLELMPSEEEVEKRFINRRLKEIVGIPIKLTRRYVETLDFRIDKQYVLVGIFFPSWLDELKEIDNVNEFIKSLKSNMGWITSKAESVAKSILTRNVISHSKEIADKFHYDYSALDEEDMNSLDFIDEEDMEILRNYILLYTNEMLYIYNKVENILDDDSKKVLKSILYSSKYTELIDSFASSSLLQKMAAPKKPENETSNENVETINDNAIVLSTHPFLSVDYKDKFCKAISILSANCNPQMVEYFFWGTSKDPDKAISKSNPLIFISDKQRFTAYVRVAYINRNVPKNVIDDLNSAVMVNNKPYKYKSIGLNVPIFSRIIDEIKTEIGWIEKNKR